MCSEAIKMSLMTYMLSTMMTSELSLLELFELETAMAVNDNIDDISYGVLIRKQIFDLAIFQMQTQPFRSVRHLYL